MSDAILQVVQSQKTGVTVATGTTASGLGTILDLIPDEIGKLATLIGIILSLTLIYVHIIKIRSFVKAEALSNELKRLEIEKARKEHQERMERRESTG